MIKRMLTTSPAANISHSGAADSISGSEVSWAEPAYTTKVMSVAMPSVRPDLTKAMPVTKPQVPVAIRAGTASRVPALKLRHLGEFSHPGTTRICATTLTLCNLSESRYCKAAALGTIKPHLWESLMSMSDRDGFIWYDGKLVPWRDATTHVLTHSLHYGLAVFEGVRAYNTDIGTAIFRLQDHTRRLFNSAHIYQMEMPYDQDAINA